MARYTADQIKNWDTAVETNHHEWIPARPENHKNEGIRYRLRLAWRVFIGEYDVLDWEEHRAEKK